jgi:hypothetical protein
MTHQVTIDREIATSAAPAIAEQEIRIYSHSTLFDSWLAWVFGFVIALTSAGQEEFSSIDQRDQSSSRLGLAYILLLLILIIFTNVRLRGIKSVSVLLALGFVSVLLAWFGWWDKIAKIIPYLSVHMVLASIWCFRGCGR